MPICKCGNELLRIENEFICPLCNYNIRSIEKALRNHEERIQVLTADIILLRKRVKELENGSRNDNEKAADERRI